MEFDKGKGKRMKYDNDTMIPSTTKAPSMK